MLTITESIRKIFGFSQLEINPAPDDSSLQVFVDGRSYGLNELGAGLAQFVLVLATIAVKKPHFVLIDEPELNLHPSLQIDFLTTIGPMATTGVLLATHGVGLARAVSDRRYSLMRSADGSVTLRDFESTPRLAEFVGELSFGGYR